MNVELFLARLDAFLDALRAIPVDALLLGSAGVTALLAMSIVARIRATFSGNKADQKMLALQNEIERLATEVATSRKALDTERQWRMTAEKAVAQAVPKPVVEITPLPPRELHDLLERAYPDAAVDTPAVNLDPSDVEPLPGRSRTA